MGLAEIQIALARFYTDAELRKHFLEDSKSVGRELNLSDDEIEQLSAISSEELSFFADSLVWKRLNEVEKLLPLSRKVLKEEFIDLFHFFAPTYNPTTIKKHLEDAIAFCEYLKKEVKTDWIVDLIRFEKTRLEFNGLEKRLMIAHFNYDLRDTIEKNETIKPPHKRTWIGVWLRLTKKSDTKFYRIPLSAETRTK
jgi:hypothetical protein